MRRGPIALGLLVALAGAGAWRLARPTPRAPEADDGPASGAPARGEAPGVLAGALGTPRVPDPRFSGIVEPTSPVSDRPGEGVVGAVVRDPQGAPLRGVVVFLEFPPYDDAAPPEDRPAFDGRPRRSDANGRVRWDHVPVPRVTLRATVPDDLHAAPAPALRGGAAVEIRCARRPTVAVRATDAAGAPVPGAHVRFVTRAWLDEEAAALRTRRWMSWTSGEDHFGAEAAADGVARLRLRPGVGPGRLTVGPPGDDPARVPHVDWDWTPTDTVVVLHDALEVSGTLRDAHGDLVTEGWVRWHRGDERWERTRVEYDGTWEIRRLAPGTVVLEPDLPTVPLRPGQGRRTVAAGSTDVVLVVDLGFGFVVRIAGWPREPGGHARLTREGPEGFARTLLAEVSLEGEARFLGVDPDGAYTLWVAPFPVRPWWEERVPPRVVHRTGIRPDAGPLVVERVAGRTARGRVVVPGWDPAAKDAALWGHVLVTSPGIDAEATLERDGAFAFDALPEGTWEVRVDAETTLGDRNASWQGTGRVTTDGEPATIPVREAPPAAEDR